MQNIFISYASANSSSVDHIVALLKKEFDSVWFDKDNLKSGDDWWRAILDGIHQSDALVFMYSEASIASEHCKSELEYAARLNCMIVPLVIDTEEWHINNGGKFDLKSVWRNKPNVFAERDIQFTFYDGYNKSIINFADKIKANFVDFTTTFKRNPDATPVFRPRPDRPLVYLKKSIEFGQSITDSKDFSKFASQIRAFRNLKVDFLPDVAQVYEQKASIWEKIIQEYTILTDLDLRSLTGGIHGNEFITLWDAYLKSFPRDGHNLYDPFGYAASVPDKVVVKDVYVEAMAFLDQNQRQRAQKKFKELASLGDALYTEVSNLWLGILADYDKVLEYDTGETSGFMFKALQRKWQAYTETFPREGEVLFDPEDIQSRM